MRSTVIASMTRAVPAPFRRGRFAARWGRGKMPSAVEAMRSTAAALTCRSGLHRRRTSGGDMSTVSGQLPPEPAAVDPQVSTRLLGEADHHLLDGAHGLRRVAGRPGSVSKRAIGDSRMNVMHAADVWRPRLDENFARTRPSLQERRDRTAIFRICSTSRRVTSTASGQRAKGACGRTAAKELVHLAREDPLSMRAAIGSRRKHALASRVMARNPPERDVAPDGRIRWFVAGSTSPRSNLRREGDRVFEHAVAGAAPRQSRSGSPAGLQSGHVGCFPRPAQPQVRTGRSMRPFA